jgi:two-component system chemotaxis sensor kinase CheA
MELSHYGEIFLSESRENVSALNHLLLALEANPADREPLEGVFRAVHTIKGMSATMGYSAVTSLAHEMETLLDLLRRGDAWADRSTLNLLFAATDALERGVELAVEGREAELDPVSLTARLRQAALQATPPRVPGDTSPVLPGPGWPAPDSIGGEGGDATLETVAESMRSLTVQLTVDPATSLPSVRAFLALRRARELGDVSAVHPAEEALSGDAFAGELRFVLQTDRDEQSVSNALRAVGELQRVAVYAAVDTRLPVPGDNESSPSETASREEPEAPQWEVARARHVRVDLRRLDALTDQVGELVILRDRLERITAGSGIPELDETVDQASRLIADLRSEVMHVRMVPVWQVFDRFPRLVRDAAQGLGKQVNFVLEGREIEFDRSMLDELGDAIVHLLRNAVDHGIETAEARRLAGKPPAGTLRLRAAREGSRAVIRVEDDGRGISRSRVVAAAVARGAIPAGTASALGDDEVLQLITRPGFSTAEQVTDVSGRGVGLDVVATRVRALGGALDISSEEGIGTCFTLRLPLTLAVLRALLVRAGDDVYAIPLLHVSETVEFRPGEIRDAGGRAIARLRDELIPVLRLRHILQHERDAPPAEYVPVVVLEIGEQPIGLEVDSLVGQQEIVVKNFDGAAGTLPLFSGATILSDGRPALILDAGSLVFNSIHTGEGRGNQWPQSRTLTQTGTA